MDHAFDAWWDKCELQSSNPIEKESFPLKDAWELAESSFLDLGRAQWDLIRQTCISYTAFGVS